MLSEERKERMRSVAAARLEGCIVLEDIYDPHNAEAVFRSCDAFGIQRVCLIFDQGKPFNPAKMGKATSSSAHKWLDFEVFSSARECLDKLHAEGYDVAATALADNAEELFTARFTQPKTAIMIGNEHDGLSAEALKLADRKLMIPMRGMVQSLNLSVTAALCLYELTRQRLAAGIDDYLLPESEQARLADDFLVRALPKRLRGIELEPASDD